MLQRRNNPYVLFLFSFLFVLSSLHVKTKIVFSSGGRSDILVVYNWSLNYIRVTNLDTLERYEKKERKEKTEKKKNKNMERGRCFEFNKNSLC